MGTNPLDRAVWEANMRRDPVKMIKKTSIWHSKLYTSMHTQAGMTRFCQHAAHFYEYYVMCHIWTGTMQVSVLIWDTRHICALTGLLGKYQGGEQFEVTWFSNMSTGLWINSTKHTKDAQHENCAYPAAESFPQQLWLAFAGLLNKAGSLWPLLTSSVAL